MTTNTEEDTICIRCKENTAVLDLRSDAVCQQCYSTFIASKVIKRLEVLQRETRGNRLPTQPQRYLVALSRGPSSTTLLHILNENVRKQKERGMRVKFEIVVVHIISEEAGVEADEEEKLKSYFPDLIIHNSPLSHLLSTSSSSSSSSSPSETTQVVDWSSLGLGSGSGSDSLLLSSLLGNLPSASARADVTRLLTRHAILAAATRHNCDVILLGYNTTSLAELTLTETAKGRGFGIPWLVNDGLVPVPHDNNKNKNKMIPVYSPLREIFRKEILTYISITTTTTTTTNGKKLLADLFPTAPKSTAAAAVVSHRDLSLDDVVGRFFVDVEASYPSVVANVVRTTGKLERGEHDGHWCGLCGSRLDSFGDERWKGEIGEVEENGGRERKGDNLLCYGCERSVKG
ncbi:hypothetical protein GGS20DRAFT_539378 [Poronia punctata]|nr:hypothetical protein GGS20DRAFT_539378 [Poronia punctata]